jgi:pimeloyl-ACP methyl ester carboxylesterase
MSRNLSHALQSRAPQCRIYAHQMILNTNNGPLYFEVAGNGTPLVFASGWAMSCECWRPVVTLLQSRYRCLIYDARGTGRSQPVALDASFTIADHAEDLHQILDVADLFDAVMIGHDLGALVVATCATTRPQEARAMAVVSPRAGMSPDDVKHLAVSTPASLALRELASYPLIRNLIARRFSRAPQPFRDRLFNDFADLSPRAVYETALAASETEAIQTLEHYVARKNERALFICGEKDKKGTAQARRLFACARAGRLATLRNCGYLPMLEYPRQFAKLIDDFAAAAPGPPPHMLIRT